MEVQGTFQLQEAPPKMIHNAADTSFGDFYFLLEMEAGNGIVRPFSKLSGLHHKIVMKIFNSTVQCSLTWL